MCLFPITLYFLLTARRGRAASRAYLTRIAGRPARWSAIAKHFYYFASTILDRLFLLIGRYHDYDIRWHHAEIVDEKLHSGKGCILLGSHLGSFEVLRAIGVVGRRYPIRVLMYPDHNQAVTRLLHTLSPEVAETVIPIGTPETLLRVKEALERGCLVGMLGDRVAESDKVVRCEFLGENVNMPAGPVRLALTLGVPVVLFFGLYGGGNRYDVYFEDLWSGEAVEREVRDAEVQTWTQRYANRLAYYARLAPYNWFNFYDDWAKGENQA
jgi:predicted LPLAT superfamily acyltransferase